MKHHSPKPKEGGNQGPWDSFRKKVQNAVLAATLVIHQHVPTSLKPEEHILEGELLETHLEKLGGDFQNLMITFKDGSKMSADQWRQACNEKPHLRKENMGNVQKIDVIEEPK